MAKFVYVYLVFVAYFAQVSSAEKIDFSKDLSAKDSFSEGNKILKRSIDELNTAWTEFFSDVDLSATEKESIPNLPQWKAHLLLRNPRNFSDFLRYIQEKRADYIPRMGRRSGPSQEKEDKIEFYTPRLGRSYSGN